MEKLILKAETRDRSGKTGCKHLRREGRIPAVVYKDGEDAQQITVDNTDLWHILHTEAGENAIITLDTSGDKKEAGEKTVIVQEVQQDPINDKFVHVDFHEISLKDKIQVNVPVVLKGEPKGVTEEDGVMAQIAWEIEVECLPTAIPENFELHVEELMMNDSLHVSDIESPEDVTILNDPDDTVVAINPPQTFEEPEEEEALAEEGGEPEVIKKGKEEGEGEEDAEESAGSEEA
ncbi:MAG: 50S ribosomal protein L25 [Candidatus Omnitrophica bacterium]|nr:50S ribosomal protein L25 [Candidatus Omnitrophota bacterium]